MQRKQTTFDHGKTLPFVWIAIIICVFTIMVSIVHSFRIDSILSFKDISLTALIFCIPSIILIFLYGYYVENLGKEVRTKNNTNLSRSATFSLVLNYFWLFIILISLKDALFWGQEIELDTLVKSLLMLLTILANVIFITSIYKRSIQQGNDLIELKNFSLKIKFLVISNLLMLQLAIIYIKTGVTYIYKFNDDGIFHAFPITVAVITLWAVLRRNKQISVNSSGINHHILKVLAFLLAVNGIYWCYDRYTAYQEVQQLKVRILANMVFVKGGDFMMGDAGYTDENGKKRYFTGGVYSQLPAHKVTLTHYSINAYETTFEDYDAFTHYIGLDKIRAESRDPRFALKWRKNRYTQTHPAMGMDWNEAREYCQWLGEEVGYPMDLPTEAQWEYAARSRGLSVDHATNNGKAEYGVNIADHGIRDDEMQVGSWPPNPLGIYDMTGSVDEWTVDLSHSYPTEPQNDPIYDDDVTNKYRSSRMIRGFGTFRGFKHPPEHRSSGGIRCVINHPEPLPKQ